MKKLLIAAYLIGLHLVAAALLWRTSLPVSLGINQPPEHVHISDMREVLTWRDATTPPGAAVFLGDSLTERLAVAAVESGGVNFGVSRSRTDQLFIPEASANARRIYLLTGTNDFMQGKQAGIETRLANIVARLPADRSLVWTGIMLPEAAEANAAIKRLCAERGNCTYIAPVSGPGYFTDGVHLSAAGYKAWIGALRSTN